MLALVGHGCQGYNQVVIQCASYGADCVISLLGALAALEAVAACIHDWVCITAFWLVYASLLCVVGWCNNTHEENCGAAHLVSSAM